MADEGHGEIHLPFELAEKLQHLRLRRDIEAGDDLVGEHEVGREHDRARDADALTLAAGQFVRVAVEQAAWADRRGP